MRGRRTRMGDTRVFRSQIRAWEVEVGADPLGMSHMITGRVAMVELEKSDLDRVEEQIKEYRCVLERIAGLGDYPSGNREAVNMARNALFRFETYQSWKDEPMRRTYAIELKINFNDDARHDVAMKMMRKIARQVLTQSTLISDGREPMVALKTEDYFEGITDQDLQEAEDKDTRVL